MDIVIIGTGNVASVLGRKFYAAGHRIVQVVGRNSKAASALAYEWNTISTNYTTPINRLADIYIICVSDGALQEIADNLKLPGKVVAHTAASVPKEVLKSVTQHYGVLYPLQSLRKESKEIPEIPLFIDAADEVARKKLQSLASSISTRQVSEAGDDTRLKLHVAAVFVSNFVNHLYVLAEQYCRMEGLDFKQLVPLLEETAKRIETVLPHKTQTGPAVRHDSETIRKHLSLLSAHPRLMKIYKIMTESIQED
jgi:predicted short-subunit dehydrogenase-like oxidoreductase (DUF2520 family)